MTLGITSIQRDRAPWIKEWVVFHYLVGFRKFYIFPHNCSDNTVDILKKLKDEFNIEIFFLDLNLQLLQLRCYQYSCENFLKDVDWMAFIDGDEFLFPTNANSVQEVLSEYTNKKISALGVYWSCFGSSGHKKEPNGLIIENYKYRAADGYHNNRHVKSIVKGGRLASSVTSGGTAHVFNTPVGTFDENLRPIASGWTDYEPTYNKLRINHYVTQSKSNFLNFKKNRVEIFNEPPKPDGWWEEHDRNDVLDTSMDKFIKPLKNLLKTL